MKNLDTEVENHLNYNPWLRGIYDEAKRLAADDTGTVLEDGLTGDDLNERAQTIRRGDYNKKDNKENTDAKAVPQAYFTFLYIIGGFKCRSVQLYNLGNKYLYNDHTKTRIIDNVQGPSVRERVITGKVSRSDFYLSYPIQITLGKCDHGEYVYDRRYDSYFLTGFGHTTNFNNCGDMLSHSMYRARENVEEYKKARLKGKEFYESETIKKFFSKVKETDMVFFPDEDQGIDYEEKFGYLLNCFNEKVTEKPYKYFLDILEKDNDDFLAFLYNRCGDGPRRNPYSEIVTQLMIFTALRYHENHFEDFVRKLGEGMHPRYLMMGIAKMRGDYATAFEKKSKRKSIKS